MGKSNLAVTLERLFSPQLFKALCEPMRIKILRELLQRGPQTVSAIAACCPVDISVVSRHLGLLRDCGVLAGERRGKEIYYRLEARALARVFRDLADLIERCCDSAETPNP